MRIPEHVVHQPLDNEVIVLDLNAGRYFSLNGSGARIWSLVCSGLERRQIIATMLNEFDVNEDQLATDVDELLDTLVTKGLVTLS